MDEFALIRRYFEPLGRPRPEVRLGIGDDAALLALPPGSELCITTDTLVAGRHFAADAAAADVGWKALAVNLSDLAAMGAAPLAYTLALTLPEADKTWLQGLAAGLDELAAQHDLALIGGDTTRGPLSLTLTAFGAVPAGRALRRQGAREGDLVCVTGTLGDAALALQLGAQAPPALRQRLHRPQPRLAAGQALRELASAGLDLSDGLAGDLAHLCRASGVGASVRADLLPTSAAFAAAAPAARHLALQAQGGDDYELCLTLPPERVEAATAACGLPLTVIGRITREPGVRFCTAAGEILPLAPHGYRHFT
ncbi:MAG: thiamine-phosphate kinase [Gammaproteobacteria bacterium]